jgi:amidophosphoribosyltransferase
MYGRSKLKEKCGIVGAYSYSGKTVMPIIMNSLKALQHRGQESWGVAAPDYPPYKKLGLVAEYNYDFVHVTQNIITPIAIGHVRYSTIGTSDFRNVQPIQIGDEFLIAHNGTITNSYDLEKALGHEFSTPTWVSDTNLVGLRLLQLLRRNNYDWFKSFEILSKEIVGAYCFIILTKDGDIYAIRDDKGFRPLCIGKHKDTDSIIVASESCALSITGAILERDINPGEIVKINKDGIESSQFSEQSNHAHCAFEYTYFAHPSSYIEGKSVYATRKNVGKMLAKRYHLEGDIVIPVPDSARPAALGYYEESGISFEEGLLKDRYGRRGGLRSFIQPSTQKRLEITRMILPLIEAIRGNNIIVVDDSIVRGNSSKQIVRYLKNSGAKKISLLSTFPPITYACYAGIDFPTQKELVAYQSGDNSQNIEEVNKRVADIIKTEFVGYNDLDGLYEGIGLPKNELCTSCITGDYSCLKNKPKVDKKKLEK